MREIERQERRVRSVPILAVLATLAFADAARAQSAIPCMASFQPGCKFSVNGKQGPFISRVDDAKLNALDVAVTSSASKGLASSSLNRGRFSASGLPMPETVQAMTGLLARLQAKWPHRNPGAITIHIFGSTAYAPRAKPDNSIIVPIGLIERAQTDDEVAWVIAHEFSHIALRHYARTAELMQREHGAETLEMMAEIGLSLSEERVSHSGATFQFYQASDPDAAKRSDEAWSRSQQLREVLLLGDALASREQEDEADADGFDLAWAAGYDAEGGSTQALTVVEQDDKRAAARAKSLQDKIQEGLRQSVSGVDVVQTLNGNVGAAMNDIKGKLVRKVIYNLTEVVLNTLSQNHRPARVRIKGLAAYAEAAYPDTGAAPREPTHAWLDAVRARPEFQEAVVAVNARDKALEDIDGGDAKRAQQDPAPALSTRYAHAPLILDVQGAVFDGLSDFADADRSYEEADRAGLPPPPPPARKIVATPVTATGKRRHGAPAAPAPQALAPPPSPSPSPRFQPVDPYLAQTLPGYNDHILLLVRHEDFPRARAKIHEAEGRFGDHTRFLPAIINIAARTHDNAGMMQGLDECFATEDEALRAECRDAIYDDKQHKMVESLAPEDRAKIDGMVDRTESGARRVEFLKHLAPQTTPAPKSPGG